MSNPDSAASSDYLETLLSYYEDEISGEAYFYALADHFAEKELACDPDNLAPLLQYLERRWRGTL